MLHSRNYRPIKYLSVVLIASALGLELLNSLLQQQGLSLPNFVQPILPFERIALCIHAIEAAIACRIAQARQQNPWQQGCYIFFVGFPGLVELTDRKDSAS